MILPRNIYIFFLLLQLFGIKNSVHRIHSFDNFPSLRVMGCRFSNIVKRQDYCQRQPEPTFLQVANPFQNLLTIILPISIIKWQFDQVSLK